MIGFFRSFFAHALHDMTHGRAAMERESMRHGHMIFVTGDTLRLVDGDWLVEQVEP